MAESSPLADAHREALEAYSVFYAAVSEPGAANTALARFKEQDEAQFDAQLVMVADLPRPHPALPLRLLALIAMQARYGALEWTYAIPLGPSDSAARDEPAPRPLVDWHNRWEALLDHFYPELRRVIERSRDSGQPWEGWSPPPDDRPFGANRLDWDETRAIARDVAAAFGHPQVDAHTLWLVVLREGFFDLEPLIADAETDPTEALEDALAYASGGVSSAR